MTSMSLPLSLEQVQSIRKRAADERASALAAISRGFARRASTGVKRLLQLQLRYKPFPR